MEFSVTIETGEGARDEREYAFVMMAMDADVNDVEQVTVVGVDGARTTFDVRTTSDESYSVIMREARTRANASRLA